MFDVFEGDRHERLKNCKNFAVYYNFGQENKLCKYNLVIIEPGAHSLEEVKTIKASGTLVLAYVSVLEVNKKSAYYGMLKAEDFCSVNGKILKNQYYDNYIVKLYSDRWYKLLIYHIGSLLTNGEYDGIFLDTLGDLEYFNFPDYIYQNMCSRLFSFVKEIRSLFQDYIVLQNNGIERIYNITAQFIDGICWENPPQPSKALRYLKSIERATGLRIFIITDKDNTYFEKLPENNSFLIYKANGSYMKI